jgi:integrase/recombinase XerD
MNKLMIENFLDMLASERFASKNTLSSYSIDLNQFSRYLKSRSLGFFDATTLVISEYLVSLQDLSARSLSRKISALRSFYNFLFSERYMDSNPVLDIEMPKLSKPLPKALEKNEMAAILHTSALDSTPYGIRINAMLNILYSSGMRVSELISLKLTDLKNNVSNSDDIVSIIIKGKGAKDRLVIINHNALKAVDKYLQIHSFFAKGKKANYLFPSLKKNGALSHITRQRFFQELKQVAIKAGINPELISPHKIRHSFATHLLKGGMDLRTLQELMGHSDITSTQIYTKITNSDMSDLVLNNHPIAKGDVG